ncbi:hypothetical protein HYN56_22440 [Flavobacterium crocinum]|uniref:Uncharacterized protein n=1 Tax=Flavobacterium crocinum TaxID=2183896 RepID=A0A2S1YRY8_9FLAO|nr:hypothetical protein HYN56_22440 [Flavobacterium crocinum]
MKNAFTFAPRKYGKFIEGLEGKVEKLRRKKVSFFFKFFLRETKRISSFAPALRNKRRKQNYVRRHIELTAVLSKRQDK